MITTVKIIDLGDIHNASLGDRNFKAEVAMFYDHNPHNSGWSTFFGVQDPSQCEYYPLINDFLLKNGAEVNENILIRSYW